MRKNIFLILILLIAIPVSAQRKADYGFSLGTTSYLGDINQVKLFYKPRPAGQIFYRYNFNPRQAMRANFLVGNVSANDLDFNNSIQQSRAKSFNTFVGELGVTYEFNFFPYYTPKGRKTNYSPYLSLGAALSAVGNNGLSFFPSIPFSLGVKVNLYKNIGFEFEYGFRKTFYDNFDGLTDMIDPNDLTWSHNNDWYSFIGVGITWKMYSRIAACPAFNEKNVESKFKSWHTKIK
jgi:hypothetical protein